MRSVLNMWFSGQKVMGNAIGIDGGGQWESCGRPVAKDWQAAQITVRASSTFWAAARLLGQVTFHGQSLVGRSADQLLSSPDELWSSPDHPARAASTLCRAE